MQNLKFKNNKTNVSINKFNTNLFACSPVRLFTFSKLLRIVKKMTLNRQFSRLTCFIIHVGLDRIGEKTYA